MKPLLTFMIIEYSVWACLLGYLGVMIFRLGKAMWKTRQLEKLLSTPEGKKAYEDAVLDLWNKEGRIDVDVQVLSKELKWGEGPVPKLNFSPELNRRIEKWWKSK